MLRSLPTCEPSRANSIVAEWLELWPVSPARITQSQGSVLESSENTANSGTTSRPSFATWDRTGCFWRTSQASMFPMEEMQGPYFPRDSGLYLETWPISGSMLNGCVYERPTLELRTGGLGGSAWPTSRAEDSESAGNHPGAVDSLTGATRNWGTPQVTTNGGSPSPQCTGNGSRLEDQVSPEMWPTVTANPATYSNGFMGPNLIEKATSWLTPHGMNGQDQTGKQGRGGEFAAQAKEWQTPATDSFRSRGGNRVNEMGLDQQSRFWPTPNTPSGGPNTKSTPTHTGGLDLDGSVLNWGTPTSRDYKDGSSADTAPTNGLLGRQVIQGSHCSLPAPAIPSGPTSSPNSPGLPLPSQRKKLNPLFVEWLQGLPVGWTSKTARISSERLATWYARCRQRLHSLCSPEGRL